MTINNDQLFKQVWGHGWNQLRILKNKVYKQASQQTHIQLLNQIEFSIWKQIEPQVYDPIYTSIMINLNEKH